MAGVRLKKDGGYWGDKNQFFFLPKFGCASFFSYSIRLKSSPANSFSNLLSRSISVATSELMGSK